MRRMYGTAGIGIQPQKGEGKKGKKQNRCENETLTIIELVILVCLVTIQQLSLKNPFVAK